MPGKPILSLTEAAKKRLELLGNPDSPTCIRIDLKKGGCAGMEYTMDRIEQPLPGDEILDHGNISVAIAPAAIMFLIGTEIDYRELLLESGFEFRNPNVSESCGCGESVKFDVNPAK